MNLSRRSYILAVIIILLGIVSEWGMDSLAPVWRLLTAAMVLGLLIEGLLIRNIPVNLKRKFSGNALLGSPLHYDVVVSNNLNIPLAMQSMDAVPSHVVELPQIMSWHIESDTVQQQQATVTPTRLGKLVWDNVQLRLRGRFGLAWWSRKFACHDTVQVLPDRLHSSEYQKAATAHQGDISMRVTGTGHDLIGLREYQHGDPLHFMDWKATARSGKPMVRLFSDEQHLHLIIAIDVGRTSNMQAGKLTRLGHYTNVAARLAEKAIHNGDQVGLVVFADKVLHTSSRLKGHSGLKQLRTTLQQLETVPAESNPLPAIMRIRALTTHRSLIVILTDLDDGDAAAQLVKAMRLLRGKHQPVLAAIADEETLQLQQQNISGWADPYYNLAATEMIQNWEHTRYRLQRMGIPVVLTGTRHLDQQVLASYDQMKIQHRI